MRFGRKLSFDWKIDVGIDWWRAVLFVLWKSFEFIESVENYFRYYERTVEVYNDYMQILAKLFQQKIR